MIVIFVIFPELFISSDRGAYILDKNNRNAPFLCVCLFDQIAQQNHLFLLNFRSHI